MNTIKFIKRDLTNPFDIERASLPRSNKKEPVFIKRDLSNPFDIERASLPRSNG